MKLLYATSNNFKIYNMRRRLEGLPFEIITPKELDLNIKVEENGTTVVENAIKKAQEYYNKTKITTLAGDSSLYIENLSKEKQPGLFVKRLNGKELSDEEMIEYYVNLLNSIGGDSISYYITGLALVTENGIFTIEIKEDEFILTPTISQNTNHKGDPLSVISIDPTTKKYYTEMTDDDFGNLGHNFDTKCIKFLETNLIKNTKILKK